MINVTELLTKNEKITHTQSSFALNEMKYSLFTTYHKVVRKQFCFCTTKKKIAIEIVYFVDLNG